MLIYSFKLAADIVESGIWEFVFDTDGSAFLKMKEIWWDFGID